MTSFRVIPPLCVRTILSPPVFPFYLSLRSLLSKNVQCPSLAHIAKPVPPGSGPVPEAPLSFIPSPLKISTDAHLRFSDWPIDPYRHQDVPPTERTGGARALPLFGFSQVHSFLSFDNRKELVTHLFQSKVAHPAGIFFLFFSSPGRQVC